MRHILVLTAAALVAWPTVTSAQTGGSISGRVYERGGPAVASASIQLFHAADSTLVQTTRSAGSGAFRFQRIPRGAYYVEVRSLGYVTARTVAIAFEGDDLNIGGIGLSIQTVALDSLEVTVSRPAVMVEPDRVGYLVEAMDSYGGSAEDVLNQLPGLRVDMDGSLTLRGQTPALHINGQPAPMNGMSLSSFLATFPADQIERVEIIDNPSARFSAEGGAEIINIVLKQGASIGGSITVGLAQGTNGQQSGNVQWNRQSGPWFGNVSANLGGRRSTSTNSIERQNLAADPITYYQAASDGSNDSTEGAGSVQLGYRPNERLSAHVMTHFNLNDGDNNSLTLASYSDEVRVPFLDYETHRRNQSRYDGIYGNANITYSWMPRRHFIEASWNLNTSGSSGSGLTSTVTDSTMSEHELLPAHRLESGSESSSHFSTVRLRYKQPWGELGGFETGVTLQLEGQSSSNLSERYDRRTDDDASALIEQLSDSDKTTTGLHVELSPPIPLLTLTVGGRVEWRNEEFLLLSGDPFDRQNTRFFPSGTLGWTKSQKLRVFLRFSQRMRWPNAFVVDPADRSTDPRYRRFGNPDIRPQRTDNSSLRLTYTSRIGTINTGPYWNRTVDGWESIQELSEDGVQITSYENVGVRHDYGTSIGYQLPRMGGWWVSSDFRFGWTHLPPRLDGAPTLNGQLVWGAQFNVRGRVGRSLTLQGNFGYEPGRSLAQGRASGRARADMTFTYLVLAGKGRIRLRMVDPFKLQNSSRSIRDATLVMTSESNWSRRNIELGLFYTFQGL